MEKVEVPCLVVCLSFLQYAIAGIVFVMCAGTVGHVVQRVVRFPDDEEV